MKNAVMQKLRFLLYPTLLGAVAGEINAFLCYVQFPIIAGRGSDVFAFQWQIVPMGAVHGVILAFLSVGAAMLLLGRNKFLAIVVTPFIGYLAGIYSFTLILWGIHPSDSFPWENLWKPFIIDINANATIDDLYFWMIYFGLATSFYYLSLCVFKQLNVKDPLRQLTFGISSGALGSLWFWILHGPWYFSLIHGTIWGFLVGAGVWLANRQKAGAAAMGQSQS